MRRAPARHKSRHSLKANERFVALGFAAVEYGSGHLLSALVWSVAHLVAGMVQTRSGPRMRQAAADIAAGRVLWALCAYALACTRLEAIAALGQVTITQYEGGEAVPVFGYREFRYPSAFGNNADRSYDLCFEWLGERQLVKDRLPLFASDLVSVFPETDLLLALHMIGCLSHSTYSKGVGTESIRRLGRRFADPMQRPHLAALFECRESDLNQRMNECYKYLQYDKNRFWAGDLPTTFLELPSGG